MELKFDRCTQCVLSAAFPRIKFDEQGVCNFCRNETIMIHEDEAIAEAKVEIESMIAEQKGKSEYDAIMCYSGGKDSTYSLMLAKEKYGLKVLSFTLDNGWISPTAFKNINRVVDSLGVDQITLRPSKKNMKSIIRASVMNPIYSSNSLTRISAACNSCISIVNTTALKFALEKKAPFILAGFTLGQIPANAILFQNNYRFLEESREGPLTHLKEKSGDFVDDYFRIKDSLLEGEVNYPYNLNILCIEDIGEKEIFEKVKSIGWVAPVDVDGCSSNCQLNSFNNMMHEKTFSYSPYELELSHLIRKGHLSREQALIKINDQPVGQQQAVMRELDISPEDLEKLPQMYK